MRIALHDLKLDRLVVIHPGSAAYPLESNVEAVPLSALSSKDSSVLVGKRRRNPD